MSDADNWPAEIGPLQPHQIETSAGPAPSPYTIDGGFAVLIGGTANLGEVQRLLERESVRPLVDTAGRALAAVWMIEAQQASHGAHHELQVSFLVAGEGTEPMRAGPLAFVAALQTKPQTRMFCHGLWNDDPLVVAYNREVLGLNALPMVASLGRNKQGSIAARFVAEDGSTLATASLRRLERTSARAGFALMQSLGPRVMVTLARAPWLSARVVNPIGVALAENREARTYISGKPIAVDLWQSGADDLRLLVPEYADLDFRPDFLEQMDRLRFIYLQPERASK